MVNFSSTGMNSLVKCKLINKKKDEVDSAMSLALGLSKVGEVNSWFLQIPTNFPSAHHTVIES